MLRYALYAGFVSMLGCASLPPGVPEHTPISEAPSLREPKLCRGFIFKSELGMSIMICCLVKPAPLPVTECRLQNPEATPDAAYNPDTLIRLGV